MPLSGRQVRISRNGVNVVGAQADTIKINNEPLDITDKDNSGWRTLLGDVGLRTISCEVKGVLKDNTLLSDTAGTPATTLIRAGVVTISGLFTISGNFYLNNMEVGAEHDGVATFTATLESADSTATFTIGPYNTVLPALTGNTVVGSALTTTNGTWAGDATITYARQWQRAALGPELVTNGTFPTATTGWTAGNSSTLAIDTNRLKITNGNFGNAYQQFSVTVGRYYRVRATVVNGTGTGVFMAGIPSNASAYGLFFAGTVDVSVLAIDPTFQVLGYVNSSTAGETAFLDNVSVMEEPYADKPWTDIASATALSYTLVSADLGKYLRCRVTATNSVGSTIAYSSILGAIT